MYPGSLKVNEDPAAFLLDDERAGGVLVLAVVPSHRKQTQRGTAALPFFVLWQAACVFLIFALVPALVQTGHLRPSPRSKQVTTFGGIAAEQPTSKALPASEGIHSAFCDRYRNVGPAGCPSGACGMYLREMRRYPVRAYLSPRAYRPSRPELANIETDTHL